MRRKVFVWMMLLWSFVGGAAAGNTKVAYGIRVYSEQTQSRNELVSFRLDKPQQIRVLHTFSEDVLVRAALRVGNTYYLYVASNSVADAFVKYDMMTGKMRWVTWFEMNDPESAYVFTDLTYDESTGKTYALAIDLQPMFDAEDPESVELSQGLYEVDLNTGRTSLIGGQTRYAMMTLAAAPDGSLYGLDTDGILRSVDKTNGSVSGVLARTNIALSNPQSAAFDKESGLMYLTAFSAVDEFSIQSMLYSFSFSGTTALPTNMGNFPDNTEIVGLYIDPHTVATEGPAAIADLEVNPADDGRLVAGMLWTNPTETLEGEEITEPFSVNVYRNGELVTTLSGMQPGAMGTYADQVPKSGKYCYEVAAANGAGEGPRVGVDTVFVGRDVPGAVGSLTAKLTGDGKQIDVTWKAPSKGANGGWYDKETLTYTIVRKPDGKQMAKGLKETRISDATITNVQGYQYEVTCVNEDGTGPAATSEPVVAGEAFDVPFASAFDTEVGTNLWTVVDDDSDGYSWYRASYYQGTLWYMKYYPENTVNPQRTASDWLISPPIRLQAGVSYTLSYELRTSGALFPVDYRVTCGRGLTIDAQTTTLAQYDDFVNEMTIDPQDVTFSVPESGEWSIGFEVQNLSPFQLFNIRLGTTDAIESVKSALQPDGKAYDLGGRRASGPLRGIYIKEGKIYRVKSKK